MDVTVAAMILMAGLLSGFVDAVAGGGGLIMIPTLMLGGVPAHVAIATNKLCGTTGSVASSVRFVRAKLVDWPACRAIGVPAVAGAVVGSVLISRLARHWAEPIVIGLLLATTLWVVFKARLANRESDGAAAPTSVGLARMIQSAALGMLLGFHDGFFGPGTGTLLVVALLALWSLNFVRGTGSAKVIALMTNLAAVISFLWLGAVDLPKGLVASAGTIAGAYAGASVVATWGERVSRPLFALVTSVIVVTLVVAYVLR
jgi:uncharacterized membrane protein YfcA